MGKVGREIFEALESGKNLTAVLSVFLFLYIFIYFFIRGITTTPWDLQESDSLAYHIPIAESIADKKIFTPPDLNFGLGYYPGNAESILALFIILGIPLNLFNLLSLMLLFIVVYLLARRLEIGPESSLVLAISVSAINSVLRLVNTQTVDIWVAVFFISALYFLLEKEINELSYVKLGLALGFLTGTKYSGIFLSLVLLLVFSKKLLRNITFRKISAMLIPFTLFGLFWYLRNLFLKGSPFYPGSFLIFMGNRDYRIQDWTPIKTLLYTENGLFLFAQALISEYLIWSLLFIFAIVIVFILFRNRLLKTPFKEFIFLGFANFFVYLFTPSWPANLVSDMRYIFPSVIPLLFAAFLLARKYKFEKKLNNVAVLSSVLVLSQIAYRPKIIILWLLLVLVFFFRKNFNLKNI